MAEYIGVRYIYAATEVNNSQTIAVSEPIASACDLIIERKSQSLKSFTFSLPASATLASCCK